METYVTISKSLLFTKCATLAYLTPWPDLSFMVFSLHSLHNEISFSPKYTEGIYISSSNLSSEVHS